MRPDPGDFLGYHFERGRPRRKALDRFKDKVRERTPRSSGESMDATIASLNDMLRGWFGYFKHSSRDRLDGLDSYIRGRLRSILRNAGATRARPRIRPPRWRNHYFDELGLFSLTRARLGTSVSARSLTPLESRMREIRQSGSEGGAGYIPVPTPINRARGGGSKSPVNPRSIRV